MSSLKISSLRPAPLFVFALVLVVFLAIFLRFQQKPEIIDTDKRVAGPGDRLEIVGRHFGNSSDGSKLLVGGNALTSTGIIEWSDERILARIPRNDGAVLVKVRTRSGLSNGIVLGDSSRFPKVDYGPWLPGGPYVKYSEPSLGGPGSLVVLKGEGFGDKRGSGRIWVNRQDKSDLFGTEKPDTSLYVEAEAIQLWTDKEIRFWIPDSAASGNIYVNKAAHFSNPVPFEIHSDAGILTFRKPVQWSLRQDFFVDRIGSFPGNSLYVHIPSPQRGPGQGEAVIIDGIPGPDGQLVRSDGNLQLYHFAELSPGARLGLGRQLIVPVSALSAEINSQSLRPYDKSNISLVDALGTDEWIKPQSVSRIAGRVVDKLGNDWDKTRAIYNYVVGLLSYVPEESQEGFHRDISDYISNPQADSEGYSFLFCSLARAAAVPARPIGGIIIDAENHTHQWWWAEVWIEGVGWVPVDPALAETGEVPLLPGVEGKVGDFYLGGLEGRHIAFSRGILDSGPLQTHPRMVIPNDRYSLQGAWEEVSGNIESYDSHWPIPRVTAEYLLSE